MNNSTTKGAIETIQQPLKLAYKYADRFVVGIKINIVQDMVVGDIDLVVDVIVLL